MVKGITKTGFEYLINEELVKDARFLELFAKIQGGESMLVFKLIERMLGEVQKSKLYDHCQDETGMVPLDALTAEVLDIFERLGEANSTKK